MIFFQETRGEGEEGIGTGTEDRKDQRDKSLRAGVH